MPDQPNILLIMSDEHAPQAMGCMGAEFALTPNLDRLAQQGAVFENAYCNFALCVPSRASLMSGLLCHRIQAHDNGSPLPSNVPTWAHMLGREGYRTVLDGKMHFIGPDQLHGFDEHWHESGGRVSAFRWGEETPDRTGYLAWENCTIVPRGGAHRHPDGDLRRLESAREFLRGSRGEQPFCLVASFGYPHYPQVCTQDAYDRYEGVTIPDPVPRGGLHERNRKWSDEVWGFDRFDKNQVAHARRVYLAMVSMLDDWVGQLLAELEEAGVSENTVVIYTSDHGDMWGEHGLWGKNLFYEESSRVPLVVSAPSRGVREGARITTPVSLVDLYPTLRDIAAAGESNTPLDGRSLWSAACGSGALDDRPVFCDYYSSDTLGPERMIRHGKWKLNYYHGQGMELFDIENDPRETTDLVADPGLEAVRSDLLARLTADWDPARIDAEVRLDQERRTLIMASRAAVKRREGGV